MSTGVSTQQQQDTGAIKFDFFNPAHFEVMQRISKSFAYSELVPDMYKVSEKNPIEKAMANCMIAIDMSQRIGASPLMIMQNLVIIYGRPSWSSKFLISCVNTSGKYETLNYRFEDLGPVGKIKITEYVWAEQNGRKFKKAQITEFDGSLIKNIQCVAWTKERGSKEVLEGAPVSMQMAIEEGWFTKDGSKWKTMPKQMLIYRAASFWTNAYAPEISMGMKTDDEILDIETIDYEEIDERVERKIQENANKTVVNFQPEQPKETPDPEPAQEQPKEDKKAAAAAKEKEKGPDADKSKGGANLNEIGRNLPDNKVPMPEQKQETGNDLSGNSLFPKDKPKFS